MPIHYVIKLHNGTTLCDAYTGSPAPLEMHWPDRFSWRVNDWSQAIAEITVIFSDYPSSAVFNARTSHPHLFAVQPTGPEGASSTCTIVNQNQQSQSFGILVTAPSGYNEEVFKFLNSGCSEGGGPVMSCEPALSILQPQKLVIKVKRQSGYQCPS